MKSEKKKSEVKLEKRRENHAESINQKVINYPGDGPPFTDTF